jgi:hypothetical protein
MRKDWPVKSGLSALQSAHLFPLLLEGAAPAPLALPDSLHRAPARARTEALAGRSPLSDESLVAAGAIATVIEKNSE